MTGSSLDEKAPPRSCLVQLRPPASPCLARVPADALRRLVRCHLSRPCCRYLAWALRGPRGGKCAARRGGGPHVRFATGHESVGSGAGEVLARPPRRCPAPARGQGPGASDAVVHLVLERVGGGAEAGDLLHLQVDVTVDEVVAHHPAGLEELTVPVQRLERLVEAGA